MLLVKTVSPKIFQCHCWEPMGGGSISVSILTVLSAAKEINDCPGLQSFFSWAQSFAVRSHSRWFKCPVQPRWSGMLCERDWRLSVKRQFLGCCARQRTDASDWAKCSWELWGGAGSEVITSMCGSRGEQGESRGVPCQKYLLYGGFIKSLEPCGWCLLR